MSENSKFETQTEARDHPGQNRSQLFFQSFEKLKKIFDPKFKAASLLEVLMSEFDADLTQGSEQFLANAEKGSNWVTQTAQIKKKLKEKELELGKAKEQIQYSEHKFRLREEYLEKRSALLRTADQKVTGIENRGERRVDRTKELIAELETKIIDTENKFDDRIRALEKQKDDTLTKIRKQIKHLESEIEDKVERTEERKNKETQSFKDRIGFYDRELARLEREASSPRVMGLEFEIKQLEEELYKLEEGFLGESPSKRIRQGLPLPPTPPTPRSVTPEKPRPKPTKKVVQPEPESDSDESFEPPIPPRRTEGRPMYPKIIQNAKVGKR